MTDPGTTTDPGSGTDPTGADTTSTTTGPAANCDENDLSDMYTRYVEPFVSGTVPTSCASCHMTGVNMSVYAQDNPCATMGCMLEQGVVDLENPADSQLLDMIMMGDPQSEVFDVDTEHAAMLEWISWSAECHQEICGDQANACASGEGTESTGVNPIGDCSEEDLTLSFFQNVMATKGRCIICHSGSAGDVYFGTCTDDDDCQGDQLCAPVEELGGEMRCHPPGPLLSKHAWVYEGDHEGGLLSWNDPEDRDETMRTMYNVVALAHIDAETPLDSLMLTKPLLEGMHVEAIYTDTNTFEDIPAGVSDGVEHGGTSKFNFGCHGMPNDPEYCPLTSAVIDCRTASPCLGGDGGTPCADGLTCNDQIGGPCRAESGACFCREPESVCDSAYGDYVDWITYFLECK